MIAPMMAPKAVVMTSTIAKASSGWIEVFCRITARKTPVKAMTEPIDRSMPPEMMTKVMPTAAMPRKALSVKRLPMTRVDRMFGYCSAQPA